MPASRLKGQAISIRVVQDQQVLTQLDSIGSSSGGMQLETKEDGFLGEIADRYDEVLKGYTIECEMQVTNSSWVTFPIAVRGRATRVTPGVQFNIVRTDMFDDGSSIIYTYLDVHFGPITDSAGSRSDFVKVKFDGKCSERNEQLDQL